jgi:ribosomal protein L11 methyltransferase
MDWLEVTIETTAAGIEPLSDRLIAAGVGGFAVEDENDFEEFLEQHGEYWDYVDDALRRSKSGKHLVKLYVTANETGMETLLLIKEAVRGLPKDRQDVAFGTLQFHLTTMSEEDWANNWKQYYKPFKVGKKLYIRPVWEELPDDEGREVLVLNPGMSFGTGQHHTTGLCLELLEEYETEEMLDLGCGSGILSIAALLLGAKHATAVDIDVNAAKIASENALLNGFDENVFTALGGDILTDPLLQRRLGEKKYGLITANIVADVILPLLKIVPSLLAENGVFLISGIIASRSDEVLLAARKAGFSVLRGSTREDWCAYVLQ